MPTRKVSSTAFSGALATVLIGVLNTTLFEGNEISGEMAAAITTVVAFAVAYFVPDVSTQGNENVPMSKRIG
jgi:hypothetical protein